MKVGVIYTKFYPLGSSASAHGYYLFSNLKNMGHELHTLGMGPNEITTDHPKSIKGLWQFFRSIEVIYIRINPWLWNDWFSLLKLLSFGRIRVIWEVNAPVEEVLGGWGENAPAGVLKWIRRQNFKRKLLSRFCDGTISVSTALQQYCEKQLLAGKNTTIPNGSAYRFFKRSPLAGLKSYPLQEICKDKFVVVWAGNNAFAWQGTNIMMDVAARMAEEDKDVVFITFSNLSVYNDRVLPNVYSFGEVRSNLLPGFLSFAHVGLCLYKDYSWSPIGFYNSPLKLYDYLSMELIVIGTKMGQIADVLEDGRTGFFTSNDVDDVISKIRHARDAYPSLEPMRAAARQLVVEKYNWENVAGETGKFIEACAAKQLVRNR